MKQVAIIPFLILFLLSCAKQTNPTGGPKDTIPPITVNSYPTQRATNFKDQKISIEFDEFIQVLNPKEQIIITPGLKQEFEAIAKKRTVTLTLKEQLKENTTYTFNFRDAVADITEKNPARNLSIAFSTGPIIDSLTIAGQAKLLLNDKPIKDATVALYHSDTFDIFSHKPQYFTKTNDKGFFEISNLPQDTFYIYAFEDKNRNLKVDSKTETYGFKSSPLFLNENKKNIQLSLIKLDARPLKITSSRSSGNYFNIKFGKLISDYAIQPDTMITSFGEDHANIRIYNNIKPRDSLQITLHATDSIDQIIDTTLYVKFINRKYEPEKFKATTNSNNIETQTGNYTANIAFNKPVIKLNFDSLLYRLDSINTILITKSDVTWNNQTNSLTITKKIDRSLFAPKDKENTQKTPKPAPNPPKPTSHPDNALYFGKGTFISADNDTLGSAFAPTKLLKYEETGVITVTAETKEPHTFINLLNKESITLKTDYNAKPKFEALPPAIYQVAMVIDLNNNKKWDPGNYKKKIEPEPIVYFYNEKKEQTINLKANWEVGPLLIKY